MMLLWRLIYFLSVACVVPKNEKDFNVDNIRVSKILVRSKIIKNI